MAFRRRYGFSAAQRAEIWRRWRAGESLHEIDRALDKNHGSIHFLLSQHGGEIHASIHASGSCEEIGHRIKVATVAEMVQRLDCKRESFTRYSTLSIG
jgi:DNA-binding transcriptional MerR regulator